MRDPSERKRLRSGRWAQVYTASSAMSCDGCSGRITVGDEYIQTRDRTSSGQVRTIFKCAAVCEPVVEDWEPSTPEGNAMRVSKFANAYSRCEYCGKERLTTRLRQKLDPRSLAVLHTMALCNHCAENSGYTIAPQGRNSNLLGRPSGLPRL